MAYWIVKVILTPILRVLYRWDVAGREHVPRVGPVIVASNHQSFIDSIFIPLVLRRRVTFVAKAEYFENPRTAWFFRAVGQIPIKRGSGDAAARALDSAREVLAAGRVLGIYPEGTRSADGRLYRGRTGAGRLALATGAWVVPVALDGTADIQPIDVTRPRIGKRVRVRIGRPMRFDVPAGRGDDPAVAREITDRIMVAIAGLSGQERVDRYANQADRDAAKARRSGAVGRAASLRGPARPVTRGVPGAGPRWRSRRWHPAVKPDRRRSETRDSHRLSSVKRMALFVVRVWVPDRPGALGAVASRIGAVRGDLVGIDILERGAGRAIDELVVELPDESLVPLLVSEIAQVDGVDVEDVRPVVETLGDPRLDALETAAFLVSQASVPELLDAMARRCARDFTADWSAVVDLEAPSPVVAVGAAPPAAWLGAFVAGSRVSVAPSAGDAGPDDVAWAEMAAASLVVVLGRRGRPFRARERRQLAAVARIVDQRWADLVTRAARLLHPSSLLDG